MSRIYKSRRAELYKRLPEGIQTVVITPGPTLQYLMGYTYPQNAHGNTNPFLLVLSEGSTPAFVLPELESERAQSVIQDAEISTYAGGLTDVKSAMRRIWNEYGVDGSVAVEYGSMGLLEHSVVAAMGVDDFVDITDVIYDIRARKDEREIALIRRAAEITDKVFRDTIAKTEPGMTEREIASILAKNVIDSDADDLGISLVASGPRTAQVYTDTTTRTIEHGDLLLIDTGVVYSGYYTDVTRTIAVGEGTSEYHEIHEAVRHALAAVREAAVPGISCSKLDTVARNQISKAGYGESFITTLGHGFGLEPHEPPYLDGENDSPVEVGHTFTIEPGIYRKDYGGIRIEDNVVMTEDGLEVLTELPHIIDQNEYPTV